MKIAILGAECTGKTRLAQELTAPLGPLQPGLVCDTAPLMTAIYSDLLMDDPSLYPQAVAQHRHFGITLVTGLDLPWVAGDKPGHGVAMRVAADQRLRQVLQRHGIAYSTVYGKGGARTACALQAIQYALGTPRPKSPRSAWSWPCDKCSDPDCEHRLFVDLLKNR